MLLTDFRALLEAAAPAGDRYHHDDTTARTVNMTDAERPNGHAHCRALLLPSSVCLNVVRGRLLLGRWQRVFLVELDGLRKWELSASVFRREQPMKVKMILPALIEATRPFWRPTNIRSRRSVLPRWPRIWEMTPTWRFRTST